MSFEELDATTRKLMSAEFEAEEASGRPYRSHELSPAGLAAYAGLMRAAIETGNEVTLAASLRRTGFWLAETMQRRRGRLVPVRTNVAQASERLAITEFNTWYVRGFARRLLDEGVVNCQVYRAALPKWEPAECAEHEGRVLPVAEVYAGHRRDYWPGPDGARGIAVPFGPSCHHTIRRLPAEAC